MGAADKKLRGLLVATAGLCDLAPGRAGAQSLRDLLSETVSGNPRIAAARAEVASAAEDIVIARAGGEPAATIGAQARSLTGDTNFAQSQLPDPNDAASSASASLTIPIYSGGEIRSSVAAARWRLLAAKANLDSITGETLVDTVTAYASLARDDVILGLRRDHAAVLADERTRVLAEMRHHEASSTDLHQAEARLALARGQVAAAEAQREDSRQALWRLTGRYLAEVPSLDPAPADPEPVRDDEAANAPDLRELGYRARAAQADIVTARSQRLPRLSLSLSTRYNAYLFGKRFLLRYADASRFDAYQGAGATVAVQLRVPLFQGGVASARVRRSESLAAAAQDQRLDGEREALLRIRRDRARLRAARATIDVLRSAVAAQAQALRGVRIDRGLAFRTTLDVLNAEQELLDGRIALASARADLFARAATLLNDAGRATELAPVPDQAARPARASYRADPRMTLASFDLRALPGSRVEREAGPPRAGRLALDASAGPGRLPYDSSVMRRATIA